MPRKGGARTEYEAQQRRWQSGCPAEQPAGQKSMSQQLERCSVLEWIAHPLLQSHFPACSLEEQWYECAGREARLILLNCVLGVGRLRVLAPGAWIVLLCKHTEHKAGGLQLRSNTMAQACLLQLLQSKVLA